MSSTQPPINSRFTENLATAIHEHWQLLLAEGIILFILGVAAIVIPLVAGLVTTVFVGLMLFAAGIVGLVATFRGPRVPGFWWSLLSAIAAIIAGGIMLWNPAVGLVSLTTLLIAYFIVDGVLTIILSLQHRKELSGRWQWLLVNGILDLVIAGLIIAGVPTSFAWALGLLVGIDLVFGGSSLMAMALAARDDAPSQVSGFARPAT
jgi:uncharacterized membrane protein HdeD (DUF308 family)